MANEQLLSPAARKAIAAALAECRRCEPMLEFLSQVGVDVDERKKRLDHLKQMATTALELTEVGQPFGRRIG